MNILKRVKNPLLISLFIIGILFISYSLVGVGFFQQNSVYVIDFKSQYSEFFRMYRENLFSNPSILIYNQGLGLGNESFGLFNYYLASPLNLLLFLFPVSKLETGILFIIYLKLVLGGILFERYLLKFKIADILKITLSISYVISGYFMFNLINPIWLDVCYVIPLMLISMDKLINNGTKKWFVLSASLMVFINFYIGYMLCLFSFIYLLFENFHSEKKFNKIVYIDYFISAFFIVLTSLFTLYTTFLSVSASKGFGGSELTLKELLSFDFSPLKFLEQIAYVPHNHFLVNTGYPNVWVNGFILALLTLMFVDKNISKKVKIINGSFILVFYFLFSVNGINLLFHGGSYPIWFLYRNSFMFPTLLLIMVAKYLGGSPFLNYQGTRYFKSVYFGVPLLFILNLFIFSKERMATGISNSILILILFLLTFFVLVKGKKILSVFLYIFLFIQTIYITFFSVLLPYTMGGVSNKDLALEYETEIQQAENLLSEQGLEAGDRLFRDFSKSPASNESLNRTFNEFGGFSSNLNSSNTAFLRGIGVKADSNNFNATYRNAFFDSFFANQYYMQLKGDSLSKVPKGETTLDPSKFTFEEKFQTVRWYDLDNTPFAETENINLYKNTHAMEKFYTTENTSSISEKFVEDRVENLNMLYKETFNKNENILNRLKPDFELQLINLVQKEEHTYEIEDNSKESIFRVLFYHDEYDVGLLNNAYSVTDVGGNKVSVALNDKRIDLAYGITTETKDSYASVQLVKGLNIIELTVEENTYKESKTDFIYEPDLLIMDNETVNNTFDEYKASTNIIVDSVNNSTEMIVTIKDNSNPLLRSTIPYDSNWKAYYEGKELEVLERDSFMAVDVSEIEEGTITFKYQIPYIWYVLGIQLFSLIFVVAYLDKNKLRK